MISYFESHFGFSSAYYLLDGVGISGVSFVHLVHVTPQLPPVEATEEAFGLLSGLFSVFTHHVVKLSRPFTVGCFAKSASPDLVFVHF